MNFRSVFLNDKSKRSVIQDRFGRRFAECGGGAGIFDPDISYYRIGGGSSVFTNRIFALGLVGNTLNVVTPAVDVLIASKFTVSRQCTIDRICVNVTTLAAMGKARVGIYANASSSEIDLYPGALLYGSAELDTSSTGLKTDVIASPITLAPGVYWSAYLAGTLAAIVSSTGTKAEGAMALGFSLSVFSTTNPIRIEKANAYAALPTPFPAGATINTSAEMAAVFVRYSA